MAILQSSNPEGIEGVINLTVFVTAIHDHGEVDFVVAGMDDVTGSHDGVMPAFGFEPRPAGLASLDEQFG